MNLLVKLAGIPRSTYYYLIKRMNCPDLDKALKIEIKAIYDEHNGRYGYRRIRDELANRGQKVNHKKVQRIMKELGLKCLVRIKKYKSYKGTVSQIAPNILDRNLQRKYQMKSGLLILQSLNYLARSSTFPLF